MPITDSTQAFFRRYEDQKKYGYLNIKDRKLQLRLLVGPHEKFEGEDITQGWPQGMDVDVVRSPYMDVARKVIHFYATQTQEDIESARWHARFDDDTMNDIDQLITWLDEDFDCQRPVYAVTDLRDEIEEKESIILKGMGYGHLFGRFWRHGNINYQHRGTGASYHHSHRIRHEWEGAVVSRQALMEMQDNQKSKTYFAERLKLPGGLGDQCLGIALYFCKIHPYQAGYMSYRHEEVPEFTLFGGKMAHVHLQLDRVETLWMDVLKLILDVGSNRCSDILVNRRWEFTKDDGEHNRCVFFNNHRFVSEHGSPGLWAPVGDGIMMVFNDRPNCGYRLFPVDDTMLEGVCSETGFAVRISVVPSKVF